MSRFDDHFAQGFELLVHELGGETVTYRSRTLTRTITGVVWGHFESQYSIDETTGDESQMETGWVKIPTDATTGIPNPAMRAIIEYGGTRYSIAGIGDRSPTAVDVRLQRTLQHTSGHRGRRR